jgi:hypothetical protein
VLISNEFFLRLTACLVAGAALAGLPAHAQERVYRCEGNPVEYINNPEVAKSRGCKLMEGGNITIVQGTKPQASSAAASSAPRNAAAPAARSGSGNDRVDGAAQRQRDSDARAILQAELRKADERLAEARKAYANGEPEKQGIESRNYQRYLDRVAELKASLARAQSDVEGIRRELGRMPAAGQ